MKAVLLIVRYVVLPLLVFVIVIHFLLEDIRLFLGAVILIGGFLGIGYFRSRRRFRRLGFRVLRVGRDTFRYEELFGDGQHRSVSIDGEMLADAPHVIHLPSPATWQTAVPDWARDRRDEIVQRIQQELGTTHFSYEEV